MVYLLFVVGAGVIWNGANNFLGAMVNEISIIPISLIGLLFFVDAGIGHVLDSNLELIHSYAVSQIAFVVLMLASLITSWRMAGNTGRMLPTLAAIVGLIFFGLNYAFMREFVGTAPFQGSFDIGFYKDLGIEGVTSQNFRQVDVTSTMLKDGFERLTFGGEAWLLALAALVVGVLMTMLARTHRKTFAACTALPLGVAIPFIAPSYFVWAGIIVLVGIVYIVLDASGVVGD